MDFLISSANPKSNFSSISKESNRKQEKTCIRVFYSLPIPNSTALREGNFLGLFFAIFKIIFKMWGIFLFRSMAVMWRQLMRCGSWLNNLLCVVFVNRNGFVVEDLSQEMSVFTYTLFLTMVSRGCCVFLIKTNLSLPLKQLLRKWKHQHFSVFIMISRIEWNTLLVE